MLDSIFAPDLLLQPFQFSGQVNFLERVLHAYA